MEIYVTDMMYTKLNNLLEDIVLARVDVSAFDHDKRHELDETMYNLQDFINFLYDQGRIIEIKKKKKREEVA